MHPATWIEREFERLGSSKRYRPESPIDQDYNCIAFAAGDNARWWWPKQTFPGGAYWPPGVPRLETLDAFVAAFATLGYAVCSGHELEVGLEKVAIYQLNGTPTHAARQLPSGEWVSKLGQGFDIVHDDVEGVGGVLYGEPAVYLSRPTPTTP